MNLLKVLKMNALQRVKKSRTCLEQCLRALVTAMKKVSAKYNLANKPIPSVLSF